MGLLSDLIKIFVEMGLPEAEAKKRAEKNWDEIQEMRRLGSPTPESEKELEELDEGGAPEGHSQR